MMPIFGLLVVIVVISAAVGIAVQAWTKMNNAGDQGRKNNRRPKQNSGGGTIRQSDKDMDRFLAEIDRLRKRTAETPTAQSAPPPPIPIARPVKQPERKRQRVAAPAIEVQRPARTAEVELLPPPPPPPSFRSQEPNVAPVVTAPITADSPEAGTTRITRLSRGTRPAGGLDMAKNLNALLGSAQGVAIAVILQEVLGKPRSKR